jgi:hypothetical protein
MSVTDLKQHTLAIHNLTPPGQHLPHMYGTADDVKAFKAGIEAEPNLHLQIVKRQQLARMHVVSADGAAAHAATAARLIADANALLSSINISGPRKPTEIAEADARRYLVKTFRELRHMIANKSEVDVQAIAEKVNEHLGNPNLTVVLGAIDKERTTFQCEADAAREALGAHAAFHEDVGFLDGRLQAAKD